MGDQDGAKFYFLSSASEWSDRIYIASQNLFNPSSTTQTDTYLHTERG